MDGRRRGGRGRGAEGDKKQRADGTRLLTEVQRSIVFDDSLVLMVQNIRSIVHYMREQPAVSIILLLLLLLLLHNGTQVN